MTNAKAVPDMVHLETYVVLEFEPNSYCCFFPNIFFLGTWQATVKDCAPSMLPLRQIRRR